VYAGLARGDRTGAVLLPLFGILCALTGVYHFFDLRSGIHAGSIVFSVGPGMYLTVFGGMGLMLSGLWILRAAMGAAKQ
jgi:Na+-transporting NADH:ubiquinone oxidoreductase subunit NqrE